MALLDFTSALYLGMHHPSESLPPWSRLTLGVPAALAEPPGAERTARSLAELTGCARAVLFPSTLHLFWDLFGMLAREPVTIFLDEGSYAVAKWGAARAAALGAVLRSFRHQDPDALWAGIAAEAGSGRRPVVVADGFCPACGRLAPVREYLALVRRFGGLLVLDDTQSLGILGEQPGSLPPYGRGGGGALRFSGVSGPDLIVGASLAKGFGVPVAALAGSAFLMRRFAALSDTRVHCSPPSVAVIEAAWQALAENRVRGDHLRRRLTRRVAQFRRGLELIGRSATGGWFPVQTLKGVAGSAAVALNRRLAEQGVRSVVTRPHGATRERLTFVITARHGAREIERSIELLQAFWAGDGETHGDPVLQGSW